MSKCQGIWLQKRGVQLQIFQIILNYVFYVVTPFSLSQVEQIIHYNLNQNVLEIIHFFCIWLLKVKYFKAVLFRKVKIKKSKESFASQCLLPANFHQGLVYNNYAWILYALLTYGNIPVQPRFRVKFLLKFKYENVVRLAFQTKFYSKTRMDGHITIREKSVFT